MFPNPVTGESSGPSRRAWPDLRWLAVALSVVLHFGAVVFIGGQLVPQAPRDSPRSATRIEAFVVVSPPPVERDVHPQGSSPTSNARPTTRSRVARASAAATTRTGDTSPASQSSAPQGTPPSQPGPTPPLNLTLGRADLQALAVDSLAQIRSTLRSLNAEQDHSRLARDISRAERKDCRSVGGGLLAIGPMVMGALGGDICKW